MTRIINTADISREITQIHTWDVWADDDSVYAHTNSNAPAIKIRTYKFAKQSGTLHLCNSTDTAYAYFRSDDYAALLERLGVDKIVRQSPNDVYRIRAERYRSIKRIGGIETDGTVVQEIEPFSVQSGSYFDQRGHTLPLAHAWRVEATVSNATWVKILDINERNHRHVTLYTLQPAETIDFSRSSPIELLTPENAE